MSFPEPEQLPAPQNKPLLRERIRVWLRNLPSTPQRIAANWLRRRGWVCFYLEPQYRHCRGGGCWMSLYEQSARENPDQPWIKQFKKQFKKRDLPYAGP